jgi:hypothetical protein
VIGPLLLGIVVAVLVVGGLGLNLFRADLSSHVTGAAGPLYAGYARVGYRTSVDQPYSPLRPLTAVMRIEIHRNVVRIGTTRGALGFAAAAIGLRHQLAASRLVARRKRIEDPLGRRPPMQGVAISGTNRRGQYLDFTLVPSDGDVGRLLAALQECGALPEIANT